MNEQLHDEADTRLYACGMPFGRPHTINAGYAMRKLVSRIEYRSEGAVSCCIKVGRSTINAFKKDQIAVTASIDMSPSSHDIASGLGPQIDIAAGLKIVGRNAAFGAIGIVVATAGAVDSLVSYYRNLEVTLGSIEDNE